MSESESVQTAFEKSIDEGKRRLGRSWSELLATGTVGGFDVGVGVLALLVVLEATGNELLAVAGLQHRLHRPDPGQERAVHRELPRPGHDRGRRQGEPPVRCCGCGAGRPA